MIWIEGSYPSAPTSAPDSKLGRASARPIQPPGRCPRRQHGQVRCEQTLEYGRCGRDHEHRGLSRSACSCPRPVHRQHAPAYALRETHRGIAQPNRREDESVISAPAHWAYALSGIGFDIQHRAPGAVSWKLLPSTSRPHVRCCNGRSKCPRLDAGPFFSSELRSALGVSISSRCVSVC